jgi:hypothetical protein
MIMQSFDVCAAVEDVWGGVLYVDPRPRQEPGELLVGHIAVRVFTPAARAPPPEAPHLPAATKLSSCSRALHWQSFFNAFFTSTV